MIVTSDHGGKDRLITCRDLVGRRRMILVAVDRTGVVVIAPPGETAVLTGEESRRLRAALAAATREHTTLTGPAVQDQDQGL